MKIYTVVLIVIATVLQIQYTNGLAVMSVDFGTEWMKIGIVSPGVPMEIALNKESKRKTPAVISFRDNVRSFGEDAQTVGIRFPKNSYFYLLELLGKNINHPLVKLYQERFPYYEIVEDEQRGTILFKHDEDTYYSPEELIAQLLYRSKEFAEQSAHQPIKECVITVPGYFNQVERKALLQAAELANLKVLQLINDHMAVALNYGIFRSKDFNDTAQYVMFYDMGATSTTATVVSMQTIKTKERGFLETHPQISIIGIGFDRTLGGLEMQIRLRDYLAKKFDEMKKTKNSVFKNPRGMAKLFKEAGRVKNVLSANADHYAQVEGLLDDQDFKFQVTREDLENLMQDLFERVGNPVQDALKASGLSMDLINQIVLVGAGTRMPKAQDALHKVVNRELAKNLNTDEAAALGAVYKAADLSTGFQVKKFITKDAVLFPIQVVFERESEGSIKQMKRTLFSLMNPYPQKKIITFNKHTSDFLFNVNYAELNHLNEKEVENLGSLNLTEISLSGVKEAMDKNLGENSESKGIKAHFAMDESGVLNLVNVEFVFEKTVTAEAEEESTLSKLGSTFSKIFGSEPEKPTEKPTEEKPEESNTTNTEQEDEKKMDENKEAKNITENKNATKEAVKENKPKIVTVKEPLKATEKLLTINKLNKDQFSKSIDKLKQLYKVESELNRRATALNNLESFVIDVQNKLYEDEFVQAATEEEVEKIRKSCTEASDWLYDEGSDADADTYEKKLGTLKALTKDLYIRVFEHRERPEALDALKSMLNSSTYFLNTAKNLTKSTNPEKDVFTDIEIETLDNLIKETVQWKTKMIEDQNKIKKSEPVILTVKSITEKMSALDREVKYLVNKLKLWRPKKVEKPKEEEKVIQEEKKEGSGDDAKEEEVVVDQEETEEKETLEAPNVESTTEKETTKQQSSDKTDHSGDHQEL